MKKISLNFLIVMVLSCIVSCSANRSTEVTETRTTSAAGSPGEVSTVRTEKTIESDDLGSCSGVLSCTVDFVGAVIAFPFRLVGGLVEAIF